MRLTWFGHSCFLLETPQARFLFDPFLDDNPSSPVKAADISCDYLLVSHGHSDHCCDALAIAQRTGATIISNYEIAEYFARKGAKTIDLNPGGGINLPFGRVKLTPAIHTSCIELEPVPPYGGTACGVVLSVGGKNIFHAGDTALFSDLSLIGRIGLDVAMLPIGDNYTMGPDDALLALDYLRPKLALPMHYNTWPRIAQDGPAFSAQASLKGHNVQVLQPGESLTI